MLSTTVHSRIWHSFPQGKILMQRPSLQLGLIYLNSTRLWVWVKKLMPLTPIFNWLYYITRLKNSLSKPPTVKLKIHGPFSTFRQSTAPTNSVQLQRHHNISPEILELEGGWEGMISQESSDCPLSCGAHYMLSRLGRLCPQVWEPERQPLGELPAIHSTILFWGEWHLPASCFFADAGCCAPPNGAAQRREAQQRRRGYPK